MDANRFDVVARSISKVVLRRAAVGRVFGAGIITFLARWQANEAEAKKKKRKKCKGGKQKCGKTCCSSGDECLAAGCCPAEQVCGVACCTGGDACIAGACCPGVRACGTICCTASQVCGDAETATCVVGQGTCTTGASSCSSGNFIFCNASDQCVCVQATDGSTRCATPIPEITAADCGLCTTDADCEVTFPDIVGVFCSANATGPCGCPAGQNLCSAPCTVV